MGNETASESANNSVDLAKPATPTSNSIDNKEIPIGTFPNIQQFQGKWLKSIRIVPLIISNKIYGMNQHKEYLEQEMGFAAYKSDNRIKDFYFNHYGLKLTLSSDATCKDSISYLICPYYHQIIKEYREEQRIISYFQVNWDIIFKFIYKNDTYNIEDIHCDHFGYINKCECTQSLLKNGASCMSSIVLNLSNHSIYDDIFTSEFLLKCCLPKDILQIIIIEYISTANNDVNTLYISKPLVKYHKAAIFKPYIQDNVICHRLDDRECEKVSNSGTSLMGKYFNIETTIRINHSIMENENEPVYTFPTSLNVFDPIAIGGYCKIQRKESNKLFWNDINHSQRKMAKIIQNNNKNLKVYVNKKAKGDDEKNENDSDGSSYSDDEEFISYIQKFWLIKRNKAYELDLYTQNDGIFINGFHAYIDFAHSEKIVNIEYIWDKFKTGSYNGMDDDDNDIEYQILSLDVMMSYGGVFATKSRGIRLKDTEIAYPLTNCILIWNPELISKLVACGTFNVPSATIV